MIIKFKTTSIPNFAYYSITKVFLKVDKSKFSCQGLDFIFSTFKLTCFIRTHFQFKMFLFIISVQITIFVEI